MFFKNHYKYKFFPRSYQSMLIHLFSTNLSCKVAPLCNVMRSCSIYTRKQPTTTFTSHKKIFSYLAVLKNNLVLFDPT